MNTLPCRIIEWSVAIVFGSAAMAVLAYVGLCIAAVGIASYQAL